MSAGYTINSPGGNPTQQAPAQLGVSTTTLSGPQTANVTEQAPPPLNLQTVAGQTQQGLVAGIKWGTIPGNIQDQLDLQQEFALQAGIAQTNLNAHTSNLNNPHATTAAQVGLGNVANLSPDNLPVSVATAAAIAAAVSPITLSVTTNQISDASAVGRAIVVDATPALQRATLGSGAVGDSLFTAATVAQALAFLQMGFTPVGQCRMQVVSTTVLSITPYNGNQLFINGTYRTIPSAGVSLSPAAYSANTATTGNVYAYWTGSAIALEWSTTGRATDTTYGHQIKSGDPTRTLVGKTYLQTGPVWDAVNPLLTISWFNQIQRVYVVGSPSAISNFNTTTPTEITGWPRAYFLSWGLQPTTLDFQIIQSNSPGSVVFFTACYSYNSANSVSVATVADYFQPFASGAYSTAKGHEAAVYGESLGTFASGLACFYTTLVAYNNSGAGGVSQNFFANGGQVQTGIWG